jgi:hypothetical protein
MPTLKARIPNASALRPMFSVAMSIIELGQMQTVHMLALV